MSRPLYGRSRGKSDAALAKGRAERATIRRLAALWLAEVPDNAAQVCRENGVYITDVMREVYQNRLYARASEQPSKETP